MGTLVQTAVNSGSGTTLTCSMGSDVTSGNFLQLHVFGLTADTVTVTKNSGTATIGSVTERGSATEAALGFETTLVTIPVTGSGSLELLVTYGSSQTVSSVVIGEVGGVSAYDGSQVLTDTGSNPTSTLTVNVTTQPAFALAFGHLFQGGSPGVGTGFTDGGQFLTNSARLEYKAVTATGNTTGNFVNALLDRNNSAMVVWTDGAGGGSSAIDDSGWSPTQERQTQPRTVSIW